MASAYIGVYWTLPVNWAGFRDLPPSVEMAAAASKTIRYQRERVRHYVRADAGRLVGEIAFMDTRTDRATEAVEDVLRREMPAYAGTKVTLLTVTFQEVHHWRPNPFMHQVADELGLSLVGLPPDPLTIDGQVFDPARHFAAWRRQDASAMTRLRLEAQKALQAALLEVPAGNGRWQIVAKLLNNRGVKTIRGGSWTPENARKFSGRLDLDEQTCLNRKQGRRSLSAPRPRRPTCCNRPRTLTRGRVPAVTLVASMRPDHQARSRQHLQVFGPPSFD